MTITPLAPLAAVQPPRLDPRPWTDETLEELVGRVRCGDDLPALAARFRRSTSSMYPRLRLLLPVDERKCPPDRVLPRLREHLADAAYDWKTALLTTPPPVPVIRTEIQGLPGLTQQHLLEFTVAAHNSPTTDRGVLDELRAECERRGLQYRARQLLADALCEGRLNPSPQHADAMVAAWWAGEVAYLGDGRRRTTPREPSWY